MPPRAKANLPVNYLEQLQKEAAEITKRVSAGGTGDRVRLSNRGFTTPDGMEGEVLEVVIVDFVSSNMFYDGVYDRDNPNPPACFAIGTEPSLLVPSKNSPNAQSQTCAACPNNQFGSAPNGKGKACKNTRLLAMIPADQITDEDAPIWIMAVPPTSLKAYDQYVTSLSSKHQTIPVGVVTEITMDESSSFAAPRFKLLRPLTNEPLGEAFGRRSEAVTRLTTEPDVSGYTPPKRGRR